jgi:rRNA processing protein Krr1/Pno1
VTEEAGNFMAALKTIGYQLNNTYDNKVDRTRNRLLQKDGKSFRVIEAMDGTYLLVKAQRKDAYPVNH